MEFYRWMITHSGMVYSIIVSVVVITIVTVVIARKINERRGFRKRKERALAQEEEDSKKEFVITNGTLNRYNGNAIELHIPQGITGIGCYGHYVGEYPYNVTISSGAFQDNQRIRSVFLPDSIRGIATNAFCNCIMLSKINIPEGISRICKGTFSNCVSLEGIELPKSVNLIDEEAFHNCTNLRYVIIKNDHPVVHFEAFSGCRLSEVHLGKDLSGISGLGRANQMDIYIPTLSAWFTKKTNLNLGRYRLFVNGSLMQSLIIDRNVPDRCFHECISLTELKFGSNVEVIEGYSFFGCISLKNLYIPKNIVVIENDAFTNCTNLETVMIPSAFRARVSAIFQNPNIRFTFYD